MISRAKTMLSEATNLGQTNIGDAYVMHPAQSLNSSSLVYGKEIKPFSILVTECCQSRSCWVPAMLRGGAMTRRYEACPNVQAQCPGCIFYQRRL